MLFDMNGLFESRPLHDAADYAEKRPRWSCSRNLGEALSPQHTAVQQETPYAMRKNDAMPLLVGSTILQQQFQSIAVSQASRAMYLKELGSCSQK